MHYMVLYDDRYFTSNYIKLHVLHTITCLYISIYTLQSLTYSYMCYIISHHVTYSLSPTEGNNSDLQIDPPVPPQQVYLKHPPIPSPPAARPSDPSLLIGK